MSTPCDNGSVRCMGERQRRRKSGIQTGLLLVAVLNKAVTVIGRWRAIGNIICHYAIIRLLKVGFFIG